MKLYKLFLLLTSLSLVLALPALTGCSDDDGSDGARYLWTEELGGETFFLRSVSITNVDATVQERDVSNEFPGMEITFAEDGQTFTIANPVEPFWSATGKLTYDKGSYYDSQTIWATRTDGVPVRLSIGFNYGGDFTTFFQYTAADQRTGRISGYYIFVWVRKANP